MKFRKILKGGRGWSTPSLPSFFGPDISNITYNIIYNIYIHTYIHTYIYIYILYIYTHIHIYIYIYGDICLCVFYLKLCVCEVLPAKFSYYSRQVLLSPRWEIYCWFHAGKSFKIWNFPRWVKQSSPGYWDRVF